MNVLGESRCIYRWRCTVRIRHSVDQRSSEGIKSRSHVLSCDYKMPRVLSAREDGNGLNFIETKRVTTCGRNIYIVGIIRLHDVTINRRQLFESKRIRKTITLYRR